MRMNESTTNHVNSSEDFLGKLLVWRPPVGMEKNRIFWLSSHCGWVWLEKHFCYKDSERDYGFGNVSSLSFPVVIHVYIL